MKNIILVKVLRGGCQNYDPFWGTVPYQNRDQEGTIILTTTHIPLVFCLYKTQEELKHIVFVKVLREV